MAWTGETLLAHKGDLFLSCSSGAWFRNGRLAASVDLTSENVGNVKL